MKTVYDVVVFHQDGPKLLGIYETKNEARNKIKQEKPNWHKDCLLFVSDRQVSDEYQAWQVIK